jgi:signal transduction histidine kinase
MKRNARQIVKQHEIAIRELPAEAMNEVKNLVDSAKPANQDEKALEHVER